MTTYEGPAPDAEPLAAEPAAPVSRRWARPGKVATAKPAKAKRPLYPRLLRLRHVQPNAWQRAVLGEGALAVAVLLVLADLASAWTLVVLPVAVAVVVKAHDLLAGLLATPAAPEPGHPDDAPPPEPAP